MLKNFVTTIIKIFVIVVMTVGEIAYGAFNFFWKNSYWGIPKEELEAMGKPDYLTKYGKGLDIDKWDRKFFGEGGSVIVVSVFVLIFIIIVICTLE